MEFLCKKNPFPLKRCLATKTFFGMNVRRTVLRDYQSPTEGTVSHNLYYVAWVLSWLGLKKITFPPSVLEVWKCRASSQYLLSLDMNYLQVNQYHYELYIHTFSAFAAFLSGFSIFAFQNSWQLWTINAFFYSWSSNSNQHRKNETSR